MAKKVKISKVLIANRGEIALRVQRTCASMGIQTVTAVSEVDKDFLFAKQAEDLAVIGKAEAKDSYLNMDKIIEAAIRSGCDGVHPGYGFLAENSEFARKVKEAGLTFIGPQPEAISAMGNKTEAKERVSGKGVPCIPGSVGKLSDRELISEASKIGYPVMIKASAGGGGRGMRVVFSEKELISEIKRARAEAKKAFSSDDVYIEKYIEKPRHVEVQVFGDSYGNVIHLGTRECSVQRRHQKLIEEAPAWHLSDSLLQELHEAAIKAARSVDYLGAGTVEFLVKEDEFYFLEMNTRLQVEHTVTEEITGLDLVALQLKVAMGEKLPPQKDITFRGHSIQFRIYAEDPALSFAPSIGKIEEIYSESDIPFREERGLGKGDSITPYYDAMISKIIVSGETRGDVIDKSLQVLRGYKVSGVKTTLPFHLWMVTNSDFRERGVDNGYVDRVFTEPAKIIERVQATLQRDENFVEAPLSYRALQYFKYFSHTFGVDYTVEVEHRTDGVFVATPFLGHSIEVSNKYKRSSNGLETALRVLAEEVLEKVSPEELKGR
ncbi:MAG: ATP-grasp domain-containing protein [Candidatus Dadabacteria bacterium]|nr:MAG: ATP-grasp domain-containing protein [Candidatus Dadabacteria bacterium]